MRWRSRRAFSSALTFSLTPARSLAGVTSSRSLRVAISNSKRRWMRSRGPLRR
jgi:hypothetical protein